MTAMRRKLQWDRVGPKQSEADVAQFEQWLGTSLPESYRSFLMSTNGGCLSAANCQLVRSEYPLMAINQLLELNSPNESTNLKFHVERSRKKRIVPNELMKIGFDDGAAYFLVGLTGEHRGEVWLYCDQLDDSSRKSWPKRASYRKIASSFDELLGMLGPISE